MRTRIEGKLSIDRWRTQLKAGVENITNYTYLDNASVKYTNANDVVSYKNDMAVRQHSGNIQVFSASLRQDFKLGILHLDNEITYQKTSNAISKNIKKNKVNLKYGTFVYIINSKEKRNAK